MNLWASQQPQNGKQLQTMTYFQALGQSDTAALPMQSAKSSKSTKQLKKDIPRKGVGLPLSGPVWKDRLPPGEAGKKVWERWVFPGSWELLPSGKGSHVYRLIYCSEDLFLLKLFSSTLLILSVVEAVWSLYIEPLLSSATKHSEAGHAQGVIWERVSEMEVKRDMVHSRRSQVVQLMW